MASASTTTVEWQTPTLEPLTGVGATSDQPSNSLQQPVESQVT